MNIERFSRRRRASAAGLAAVSAGLVLAGCGFAAAGQAAKPVDGLTAQQLPSTASHEALAQQDAERLMSLMHLPPGATRLSPRPPNALPSVEDSPSSLIGAYNVDIARFSTAPGDPEAVLAWISGHSPEGSAPDGQGATRGPDFIAESLTFDWPTSAVLVQREVLVEVAAFRHETEVRVDSQVAYAPNRPAAEQVPTGTDRVEAVITLGKGRSNSYSVSKPADLRLLESVIASLQRPAATSQPGGPCVPADADEYVSASFFVAGGTSPAVVVSEGPLFLDNILGNVEFTRGQTAEPALFDPTFLIAHTLQRITGGRLPAGNTC
jgi:hypothetical protein